MTDNELIQFADEVAGIAIPTGTARGAILTKIINAAASVRD